ncbi:hypothetical protein [Cytobacillus sp. IB215316]|uniref:hypothetical protein n=1 Tax=Cytobacillus sp. IB215316 TaxID=3097354 RepID=UPI002A13F47D|nr:hypothetical protein [Cytobacillus sp. IB215316]MDX8361095.1 hypothetical protein [Cytobacillus sp. IB215316]
MTIILAKSSFRNFVAIVSRCTEEKMPRTIAIFLFSSNYKMQQLTRQQPNKKIPRTLGVSCLYLCAKKQSM